MKFHNTTLPGVLIIEPEPMEDRRGFFARMFCRETFLNLGLVADLDQCSISYNKRRGTLRGMHYQLAPFSEIKIIRCTMGSIFDVIIDLRPGSPTFKQWIGVELSSKNRKMVYIPEGLAHGFQTLEDETEVFYQMKGTFAPSYAKGVMWNDPAFGIRWPMAVEVISEKDTQYSKFT